LLLLLMLDDSMYMMVVMVVVNLFAVRNGCGNLTRNVVGASGCVRWLMLTVVLLGPTLYHHLVFAQTVYVDTAVLAFPALFDQSPKLW
jgi:hypothetical protein